MDPSTIAAAISLVFAIAGALSSVLSRRLFSAKVAGFEISFDEKLAARRDPEKDSRLSEARIVLQRQESSAKWNRRSANSLTFSQYVIGGVLATSFVQQALSAQVVGLLGVLVLVSSLIHQTFRPDLQARGARQRVATLRRLIRHAEDELFAIESGRDDAPSIYKIRQLVSEGLANVEESELQDREPSQDAAEAA